jgi:multidrug resistance efflux pump
MKATVSSYNTDISASRKNIAGLQSQLDLANKRVAQYQELVEAGAANKFDLEQATTNVRDLQSRISAAQSQQQSLETKSNASYGGENSSVSEIQANLIRQSGIFPKRLFWLLQTVLFPMFSLMKGLLWLLLSLLLF